MSKYRIVATSLLSSAAVELQRYYGWKYFGFWDRLHLEMIDPKEPEMALRLCQKVKAFMEQQNDPR